MRLRTELTVLAAMLTRTAPAQLIANYFDNRVTVLCFPSLFNVNVFWFLSSSKDSELNIIGLWTKQDI